MIGDQYINKKLKGAAAQAAALAAADAKDTVGKLKKQGKLHYEKHIPNHTSLIRYAMIHCYNSFHSTQSIHEVFQFERNSVS